MLIRYPSRVTVNNKKTCIKMQKVRENQLTGPSRHCIYAYTKAIALLKFTNENNSNSIGTQLLVFIDNRDGFARFDEIPPMTL